MNGQYNIGDVVLRNWTLVRLIGEGSFGKVFEAKKVDFGEEYSAAIKIIPVPKKKEDANEFFSQGMTQETVSEYYQSVVEELSREFSLMSKLKGNSNIVSYEDHEVVPHSDGIGRDIFIRMELLTPFSMRMKAPEFQITRQEIIRFGIDICKALELCQKHNIIHRDIKPDNIFLSSMGDYKLGDFGVSRIMDKTTGGSSKTGTPNYMAPEVYRGERYGRTVDIYSLGIVLYQLLNRKRLPFFPNDPMPITFQDQRIAFDTRMGGKAHMPYPVDVSGRLGEIVLKACEYHAQDRYSSPTEMREDLEALLYSKRTSDEPVVDKDATVIKSFSESGNSKGKESEKKYDELHNNPASAGGNAKTQDTGTAKPPNNKIKWIISAIAVILLVAVFSLIKKPWGQKTIKPVWDTDSPVVTSNPLLGPTPTLTPTPGPVPTPTLTPSPTPAPTPVPTSSPTPVPTPVPTPTPTKTLASDEDEYMHAISLLEAGKYEEAEITFETLGDYKDSAEKLAEVWYYIGLGYETGSIGMKNDSLATSYYQLSANSGHPAGINKLGECYYNGVGKTQDYNKAFELFEEASDLGFLDADYNLGLCYENGHGVKQNKALAEAYFNIASKNDTGNS